MMEKFKKLVSNTAKNVESSGGMQFKSFGLSSDAVVNLKGLKIFYFQSIF